MGVFGAELPMELNQTGGNLSKGVCWGRQASREGLQVAYLGPGFYASYQCGCVWGETFWACFPGGMVSLAFWVVSGQGF